MGRPPYDAVARLTAWATEYAGYVRGALSLRGLPPLERCRADVALDRLMALAVDHYGPGALEKITKQLREPMWMTEETWGTGPDAVAAAEAWETMMPLDEDDPEIAAYLAEQKRLREAAGAGE